MKKLAIATLLIVASTAHATTFNAAADFSLSSNPNGVWSYGYSTTLGGPFVLDTNSGTMTINPNFSYWGTNIRPNNQGFKGGLYKSIGYNVILCTAPKFFIKQSIGYF